MFKSLFRRMAPLVAGVVLIASTSVGVAGYAYIENIIWPVNYPGNQYCTVYVDQDGGGGYVAPAAAEDNYYWWFDGTRDYAQYSDHSTVASVYPGTEAVTVYVYGTGTPYPDLSWATVDRDLGTTIYNGP